MMPGVSSASSTSVSSGVNTVKMGGTESPPGVSRVAFALIFFCSSSLGAIFVNKMCLTHYRFSYPTTLMLLQSLFTFCIIPLVSRLRPSLISVIPLKKGEVRRVALPTALFITNVTVGLSALSLVNIPMFSAFRRLTVLFVMCAEFVMLHKMHSRRVMLSVVVLTAGAFVSALGDVTFSALGYALVFINNALTAMYLASIKRVMKDLSLDPISLLYHVNALGFPFIFALSLFSGDLRGALAAYYTRAELRNSTTFLPVLLCVSASAFCVNLSTSLCTHVTSPLTTSVAGQVKNVLQTVLGFFSWGYHATPLNVIGLLVALMGQIAFARFKSLDSGLAAAAKAEAPAKELAASTSTAAVLIPSERGNDGAAA